MQHGCGLFLRTLPEPSWLLFTALDSDRSYWLSGGSRMVSWFCRQYWNWCHPKCATVPSDSNQHNSYDLCWDAERGFSSMNVICSALRSSLTIPHLSHLMFISLVGTELPVFDPTPYLRSWLAKGHRHAAECWQSVKEMRTERNWLIKLVVTAMGPYVCCFQINSSIRVYTVIS